MSLRILIAASEVVGFAKTGGLADVAGSLPRALAARVFPGPIAIVPNGVCLERFRRARRPVDGLPPGRIVLWVHRLEPRKGFAIALRAFTFTDRPIPPRLENLAKEISDFMPNPDKGQVLGPAASGLEARLRARVYGSRGAR